MLQQLRQGNLKATKPAEMVIQELQEKLQAQAALLHEAHADRQLLMDAMDEIGDERDQVKARHKASEARAGELASELGSVRSEASGLRRQLLEEAQSTRGAAAAAPRGAWEEADERAKIAQDQLRAAKTAAAAREADLLEKLELQHQEAADAKTECERIMAASLERVQSHMREQTAQAEEAAQGWCQHVDAATAQLNADAQHHELVHRQLQLELKEANGKARSLEARFKKIEVAAERAAVQARQRLQTAQRGAAADRGCINELCREAAAAQVAGEALLGRLNAAELAALGRGQQIAHLQEQKHEVENENRRLAVTLETRGQEGVDLLNRIEKMVGETNVMRQEARKRDQDLGCFPEGCRGCSGHARCCPCCTRWRRCPSSTPSCGVWKSCSPAFKAECNRQ